MSEFRLTRPLVAYCLPFALFMAALLLVSGGEYIGGEKGPFWLTKPQYWIFPLQTLLCLGALIYFWRDYEWGGLRYWWVGVVVGLVVLGIWVAPQVLFGLPARNDGFNPDLFAESPVLYWGTVLMRFFRLAIIVPLLEEIFWRGFLMRFFTNEDFRSVPFGSVTFFSFTAIVVLFSAVHSVEDFAGAILCALAYNVVAIYTRSLAACVIAHAVTNLGLGFYVMATKQWGFW